MKNRLAEKKASLKKVQEDLAAALRDWQKVENASVAMAGRVMEKTENPILRLVMEIIQRDSQMHYRVQEWIADSLDTKPVSLSPDELGQVWDLLEEHIRVEKKTIDLARTALGAIEGKRGMLVQQYLLRYLLADEEKHNRILADLEVIKGGMYPYA